MPIKNNEPSEINAKIGAILALYAKSPLHVGWSVGMAMSYILPGVFNKQYIVFYDVNGFAVAFASWAFLDLGTEHKYINDPHSLTAEDWRSGDRLWLMDYISPFGKEITTELFHHLTNNVFPNNVARALRLKPGSKRALIKSYAGNTILKKEKNDLLLKYLSELKNFSATSGVINKVVF